MKTAKYFSATWCGPCKTFKPIMQELTTQGYQIGFFDVDQNSDMARKYNVRSVPTTIIEENGVVVDTIIGVSNKTRIMEALS
jgi:thioredoxin 1